MVKGAFFGILFLLLAIPKNLQAQAVDDRFYLDGLRGYVSTVLEYDNELFVSGNLSNYSGMEQINGVAKWDGEKWVNNGISGYGNSSFLFTLKDQLYQILYNHEEPWVSEIFRNNEGSWKKIDGQIESYLNSYIIKEEEIILITYYGIFSFDGDTVVKLHEGGTATRDVISTIEFNGNFLLSTLEYIWFKGSLEAVIPRVMERTDSAWVELSNFQTDSTGAIYSLTNIESKIYGIEIINDFDYSIQNTDSRKKIFALENDERYYTEFPTYNNDHSNTVLFLKEIDNSLFGIFYNSNFEHFFVASYVTDEWEIVGDFVPNAITDIHASQERIYISTVTNYESQRVDIYELKNGNWNNIDTNPKNGLGINDKIYTGIEHDGDIYIGGRFKFWNDIQLNHIAKLDESGWVSLSSGVESPVKEIIIHQDRLIAITKEKVYSWDGNSWDELGQSFENQNIETGISYRDTLIISGNIDTLGANNILFWDNETWVPHASGIQFPYQSEINSIDLLYEVNNSLVASGFVGYSSSYIGEESNHIWEYKGGDWTKINPRPVFDNSRFEGYSYYLKDIIEYNGRLVASMNHGYTFMTSFNGNIWEIIENDPFQDEEWKNVEASNLFEYNGVLIGIGDFRFGDSYPYDERSLAWFNNDEWVPFSEKIINGFDKINEIINTGEGLFLLGEFSKAGEVFSYNIAKLEPEWSPMYTGKEIEESLSNSFQLYPNYPNPFNPSTNIQFDLPKASQVKLAVYNILGQQVAILVNGVQTAGVHTISFDASGLSSGMYIYQLATPNKVFTQKMLLVK